VLSPTTAAEDRADKMPLYAEAGVSHLWLIDPLLRTLEVLRLEARRWFVGATFRGDALVRAEPFESVELSLGDLWGPPRRT
jgi:Uma2 family endonuclease